jgi:hypothetical protein
MKMSVFWDVAPFNLVESDIRFRGAFCLDLQYDKSSPLKRRSGTAELHGTTSQKADIFIVFYVPCSRVIFNLYFLLQLHPYEDHYIYIYIEELEDILVCAKLILFSVRGHKRFLIGPDNGITNLEIQNPSCRPRKHSHFSVACLQSMQSLHEHVGTFNVLIDACDR